MRLWRCVCLVAGLQLLSASAEPVSMGFPADIPPYVLPENNSGIEVDIAREALAYRGHILDPHYFPIDKLPLAFRFNRVDAVMVNDGADLSGAVSHFAVPTAVYDDAMVHLVSKNLVLERPEQMDGLLVVGFSGASVYYADWTSFPERDGLYFEWQNQEQQVLGLYRGKFDVMITDRFIFCYYASKLARERGLKLTPVIKTRFPHMAQSFHRPAFTNPSVRDDFNEGVRFLKESGRYQAIYDEYLGGDLHAEALPPECRIDYSQQRPGIKQ